MDVVGDLDVDGATESFYSSCAIPPRVASVVGGPLPLWTLILLQSPSLRSSSFEIRGSNKSENRKKRRKKKKPTQLSITPTAPQS